MGKRWRRRNEALELLEELKQEQPQSTNTKMIEYSITPYPIKPINSTYYQSNKTTINKEDYDIYLTQAETRGYKIGVAVETSYGAKAHITGIKNKGSSIDIWGDKPFPDAFIIARDDTPNTPGNVGYNENELTLL